MIRLDTQYISLQIVRQMEYLNLVLQEVSQSGAKEEEKMESNQDEYLEEVIFIIFVFSI